MNKINQYCIVYVTTDSNELAEKIAKKLIESKLAACCSIIPQITSFYRWNDKINKDNELMLMIKTKFELIDKIEELVISMHNYSVPEIISVQLYSGSAEYLKWIDKSLE